VTGTAVSAYRSKRRSQQCLSINCNERHAKSGSWPCIKSERYNNAAAESMIALLKTE
jgi:hypothetical protein